MNEKLLDLILQRQLILERVKNSLSADTYKIYKDIIDDIIVKIKTKENINVSNMNKLIKELDKRITPDIKPIYDSLFDLIDDEIQFITNSTNDAVGIDIFAPLAKEDVAKRIVESSLIEGATIGDWFNRLEDSLKFELDRNIKLGVLQGETIFDIANRVKSALDVKANQARAIARTAVATVTSDARQAVWDDNTDVIKGFEHVSALDSRTTLICAARDDAVWDVEGNALNAKAKQFKFRRPPLHFSCRSVLTPVLKSWEKMGIEGLEELPKSTRASIDGQIPAETNFTEWFDKKSSAFQEQYLGKGRFELYKAGKITISDLVSQQGKTLTIEELKAISKTPKIML